MPKSYTDFLTSFPLGINSGIAPILLPKSQLSWALNSTVRGGFIGPRPPFNKQTLVYPTEAIQTAVETGFFQGAGVYRPDSGTSQVIAQISGRLFAFTPTTNTSATWAVTEITISGDLNSPSAQQAWLWQAEKWLIISDGSGALPIYYDGVSCRRSMGAEHILATATATVPPASPVPDIDGSITLQLTANYTGPYDIPVQFNGALYELSSGATGNSQVILTNVAATAGSTVASGSNILSLPGAIGKVYGGVTIPPHPPATSIMLQASGSYATYLALKDAAHANPPSLSINGNTYWVRVVINWGTYVYLELDWNPAEYWPGAISVGTFIFKVSEMAPSLIVAVTAADFTVPAVGADVTADVASPYTGADGATVWINSQQYTIVAVPPTTSSQLTLINLTDSSTNPYTFNADITSVPELPACRMGAYGLGQNWVSLVDGLSFVCSDLVNSSTGTIAYSGRDAVLRAYNASIMGDFRLPGAGEFINSMTFTATLDNALGQGPLEIGTMSRMFSVKAPFDLSDFNNLTSPMATPILSESLIGTGPMGQNSTRVANSDVLYHSIVGLASFKLARRDMTEEWGNTPISLEVTRALDGESKSLLQLGSSTNYDNRWLVSCQPALAGSNTYHQGMIALNFDLVSSLRGKAAPAYDGVWTGFHPLQFTDGLFGSTQRALAFAYDTVTSTMELYELLSATGLDNGATRPVWAFESPVLFNQDMKKLSEIIRLIDGEIYLFDVQGIVEVEVYYRPLFWPCWVEWHSFKLCATMTANNAKKQVWFPLGLGEPSGKDCDTQNDRPLREGAGFQLRVVITGLCKFAGGKFEAIETAQPKYAKVAKCGEVIECSALDCDAPDDFTLYTLDVTPMPQPTLHWNVAVYNSPCAEGAVTFSGTPPSWITIDATNNRVVGRAGYYSATTQLGANALAQTALDEWVTASVASGLLTCESGCEEPVLQTTGSSSSRHMDVTGGYAVAIGMSGSCRTSSDGAIWDPHSTGTFRNLYAIAFGAGTYAAMGQLGTLITSPDGETWTVQSAVGSSAFRGMVFAQNQFVAGNDGCEIYTSPDGINFMLQQTLTQSIYWIAFNGTTYVAVGTSGLAATSTNGTTWVEQTTGTSEELRNVVWDGSQFVATGLNGTVVLSANGVAWTVVTPFTSDNIVSLGYGDGLLACGTDNSEVWYSTNGTDWTSVAHGYNNRMCDYYAECTFITHT